METAPLKSFATWARTALIREVTARISAVLAPASPERVEQSGAIDALEKAVAAAGGGDLGRAAVADKVAYTWFNRMIALRFMDANGYTGIGVVSPQAGAETGQPEILAEAKRGNIDTAAVGAKTREMVTGLLDGTRRSDDAQGEAYALLLADYCRFWNRAMPFMFEQEGDFTELLIPANLLADDSVPSRAVEVLTSDVCQDVEVIGWLYQFYISERKREVFDGFNAKGLARVLAGAGEIPAATQLFTPHWIVRYLVENSLGRLWVLNRPSSRLVDQMDYYISPVDEETNFLKISGPEEIKIIDPACGSGHMLTYAFDLLYAIYEEEGYAPTEIPGLILTHNLYGVEIDPRAGALAAFALTMKARAKQRTFFTKSFEPRVCVLAPIRFTRDELNVILTTDGDREAETAFWNQFEHADTVGSLIQPDPELSTRLKQHLAQFNAGGNMLLADVVDWAERVVEQAEYLTPRYSIVVANPPYMGSGNMGSSLVEWLGSTFTHAKADLFSAFIVRIRDLLVSRGIAGIVTPNVWMYIKSHSWVRSLLVNKSRVVCLAELPLSGFTGATVQLCAFVVQHSDPSQQRSTYISLLCEGSGDAAMSRAMLGVASGDRAEIVFRHASDAFSRIPGSPVAYRAPDEALGILANAPNVSDVSSTRKGMATGSNAEFVREWWEVSRGRIGLNLSRESAAVSGRKWFPYASGGEYRKWYGNLGPVVNWERDGERLQSERTPDGNRVRAVNLNLEYIFKEGLSWTSITSGRLSVRWLPAGSLFSSASNALFSDVDNLPGILGLLNSPVGAELMSYLNPTLNANPGDIGRIPFVDPGAGASDAVNRLVDLARRDHDSFETSWNFSGSPLLGRLDNGGLLQEIIADHEMSWRSASDESAVLETELSQLVGKALGLRSAAVRVTAEDVTLANNPSFVHKRLGKREQDLAWRSTTVQNLVAYAIGCMFGRYSLDEPGLILADQGATMQDYLAKCPNPTLAPDKDNVVPIVDGPWFEDDIVERFRQFLRVAFGEQHFEENLRVVTESLGVTDIRDYFVKSFYKDHVQRYKNRPIYWLFSSPKGSFNALIYMHRYTPSTVSTVLNEYLREFTAKLSSSLQQHERLAAGAGTPREQAAAQKEVDRLRKVLVELEEYEHDILYPLASRQLAIELDDGVKVNYAKLGAALKRIPQLEANSE